MKLEEVLKTDFIEQCVVSNGMLPCEAIDIWNTHGEEYTEDMKEVIDSNVYSYVSRFNNDNGEQSC